MAKKSLYQTVVDDLKKAGFEFRMNDLDESLEAQQDGQTWEKVSETTDALISVAMRELGYGTRKKPSLTAVKECITKLAHENRYNPIKDYFLGLEGKYTPKGHRPVGLWSSQN